MQRKCRHPSFRTLIAVVACRFLLTPCLVSADEECPATSFCAACEESDGRQDRPSVSTVRVAAISFVPKKLDLAGNVIRLEAAFRKAKQGAARIAVAPEGALDGYIVNEIIAGKISSEQMKDVAISIHSSEIQHFRKLARELDMCLVFGFAELIAENVFNCAVFIDNRGQISGKYHKMQFAEGYDSAWWFNRLGSRSRTFETPFGRCGILICNDRWNPQLAKIPAADGAQFLVIPAFGSKSASQDKAVLSRAQETNLPVIEANVGVSLIVSSNRIAAVDRANEGITFADIVIPLAPRRDLTERDRVEADFLSWRKDEMPMRLRKHLDRLQKK